MSQRIALISGAAAFLLPCLASAMPISFSVGGDDTPASIQATVDDFRAALGDPNNANTPGSLADPDGRREINWDGGGSTDTAPLPPETPFNVFLNIRGGQFTTPGSGLTQGPPSGGAQGGLATLFGNATYGTTFGTFSAPRLFAPEGSNIIDGFFFVPGTGGAVRATVSGFGAVFTDVNLADTTEIAFFDAADALLHSEFVLPGTTPDGSLSFLGVVFDDPSEQIARVRITLGTTALGPDDDPGNGVDVVVVDDFLYAEPQAIPEPGTLTLLGISLLGLLRIRWRIR